MNGLQIWIFLHVDITEHYTEDLHAECLLQFIQGVVDYVVYRDQGSIRILKIIIHFTSDEIMVSEALKKRKCTSYHTGNSQFLSPEVLAQKVQGQCLWVLMFTGNPGAEAAPFHLPTPSWGLGQ